MPKESERFGILRDVELGLFVVLTTGRGMAPVGFESRCGDLPGGDSLAVDSNVSGQVLSVGRQPDCPALPSSRGDWSLP